MTTSLPIDTRVVSGGFGRGRSAGLMALIGALQKCWSAGTLTVVAPDGSVHPLQGAEPGPDAVMQVRDARMVGRVLTSGDIGFAESFIAGEVDTPDLERLLTTFSINFDAMARILAGKPVLRFLNAIGHALNRNSKSGSRRNIHAHYDLGDDFYRLWLDPGLNYSSALFTDPSQDLAAAQRAKHAALAEAMDLRRGQSVLEIGCGWGAFARFAATEYQAEVTAITVSPSQHAFAARMIQAEGLGERVKIALCDYRDVKGRFDRVASIEMFEAVGEAYWPAYFSTLRDRLVDGGRAALQIITIDNALFDDYRRRPDFIQMHIFPGGMLPSESRLKQETDRVALDWTGVRRFGQDYADTLAEWGRRYRAHAAEVAAQGFDDRFDRLWRYYLAYCEAGFRTRRTDVIQLGLARA